MMTTATTALEAPATAIGRHLDTLVRRAPRRPPGSRANRRATDYIASVLRGAGLEPEELPFRALHWSPGTATLIVDGVVHEIEPPPFCRAAAASGTALFVSSAAMLEERLEPGAVLVLDGELVTPLFPRAFPYVSIPEQIALLDRLEAVGPAAVIAVIDDGAAHEPVFEDPDLAFPYATIPRSIGSRITPGARVELRVEASLAMGEGSNVSAGAAAGRRAVVCAHVDSKVTTSGALDNGGGVAVLLGIA